MARANASVGCIDPILAKSTNSDFVDHHISSLVRAIAIANRKRARRISSRRNI